jgi:hypothetical protein
MRTTLSPELLRLLGAAMLAPLAAAAPLLTVGYAAYLAGSPSSALYVEAFFQVLTLAWPIMLVAGIPLHLVLRRLGWHRPLLYACAGAALALGTSVLLGEDGQGDTAGWEMGRWVVLAWFGLATGWVFRRRIDLR